MSDEWQGGGIDKRNHPEKVKQLQAQLAAERAKYNAAHTEIKDLKDQLAAEREIKQSIYGIIDEAHGELSIEREKVKKLETNLALAVQAAQIANKQLAAEREKNECTCDIDTICRVHGCPKCYGYQKQLATAIEALKEFENEYPHVTTVLQRLEGKHE